MRTKKDTFPRISNALSPTVYARDVVRPNVSSSNVASSAGKSNHLFSTSEAMRDIDNAFETDWILYLNKEKVRNGNIPGVQFPDHILNSDFNSNLEHYLQTVKKNSAPGSDKDIHFSVNVDPVLSKMYKEIESGKYSGKSFYDFDESVPSEIIDYVNRTLGIDISKYGNEITVDAIRHIINEHGANGKTDHSMQDPDDLARIKYVVNNFDKIWILDRKTSFISNSDGTPAFMIKLQKRIGDGFFYVVEAVADRSRKKLDIVSAYINKTDASLQASPAEAGSLYARSAPVSDASIKIL